MKHGKRGVSRIELLAWGAFLAVLMVVILPKIQDLTDSPSHINPAATQIEQFKTAVQLYTVDNGHPPTAAQGLDALIHEPVTEPRPRHRVKYLADLDKIPDDPWGHPYTYRVPSPNGEECSITSYGPDGKEGGGDDLSSVKGGNAEITSDGFGKGDQP